MYVRQTDQLVMQKQPILQWQHYQQLYIPVALKDMVLCVCVCLCLCVCLCVYVCVCGVYRRWVLPDCMVERVFEHW
jgi:hypothetical protein